MGDTVPPFLPGAAKTYRGLIHHELLLSHPRGGAGLRPGLATHRALLLLAQG
jgi:hypothetical protein